MKKQKFFLRWQFVFSVHVIATLTLMVFIYKLGLLTEIHFKMLAGLLTTFNLSLGAILWKVKGHKKGVMKIVTLILALLMLLSAKYVLESGIFIASITGATKDAHVISLIVSVDSPYQSVQDVENKKIGGNINQDKENIDKALQLLDEKYEFRPDIQNYSNYEYLANDLYNQTIDAMLLSESQRVIMESIDETFKEKTRVLDFVEYEVESIPEPREEKSEDDAFTVFVTGIDTYGKVSTVSRSDVNMLVTVNPKTHKILLTSIPRDYYVTLGTKGAKDKLTHAGIYGVKESMLSLEKLLDINIDYYLKTNFNSVERIVDALGGVQVDSPLTFMAYDNNHFEKGLNTVNGKKALVFARERKSLPGGDNDRVRNQQELIKGVLNKVLSPSIITNFNGFLDSVGDSIVMSMEDETF